MNDLYKILHCVCWKLYYNLKFIKHFIIMFVFKKNKCVKTYLWGRPNIVGFLLDKLMICKIVKYV